MKIIAKSLIKHNGSYFQAGQEIPGLNETEAAQLVAANVVTVLEGQVAPAKPTDAFSIPADKEIEKKNTDEVANLPISMKIKKQVLIGIARANGLKAEKTDTSAEIYNLIKDFREKENIVVEDKEPVKKPKVKNPEAPTPEELEAVNNPEDKKESVKTDKKA